MSNVIPKRRGPKFLNFLLAAVLTVSAVVDGFCAYDLLGRKVESTSLTQSEEKKDEGAKESPLAAEREADENSRAEKIKKGLSLTADLLSRFTGKTAKNKSDVLDSIKSISAEIGIADVSNELEHSKTLNNNGFVYYVFSQVKNGIDVLGANVVVRTGEDTQKITEIISSYVKLPDDISTNPKVSFDQASDAARDYAVNDCKLDPDKIKTNNEGTKYVPFSKDDVILGYQVSVTDKETGKNAFDIIVDADTGKIAGTIRNTDLTVNTDTASKNGSRTTDPKLDNETDFKQEHSSNDGVFTLSDNDRDIYVYDFPADATKIADQTDNKSTVDTNAENYDKTGFDMIGNLARTYDFFNEMFGRNGIDNKNSEVTVYRNVGKISILTDEGEKTIDFSDSISYPQRNIIVIGINSDGDPETANTKIDELAGAFAIGVINEESGLLRKIEKIGEDREKDISYALAIGIADIFGEIVEDHYLKTEFNTNADWENDSGSLKSDGSIDYKSYKPGETDANTAKKIVTGIGYDMTHNGSQPVDPKTLGVMLYDILPLLNSETDLIKFRNLVENEAVNMNAANYNTDDTAPEFGKLTDDQLEAVIDALDNAGIPTSFERTVSAGGTVKVIDNDDNECSAYSIKLARASDPEKYVFEAEVDQAEYKLPSNIHNGVYIMTVCDKKDPLNKKSISVVINDNRSEQKVDTYPSELKIFTRFGMKSRDVVLVLDVSGSMSGTPIEQTRQSGAKFVETVLEQSPSTRISIVEYSDNSNVLIETSNNKAELTDIVTSLNAGGRTATYSGLDSANTILEKSKSDKRLVVLMSDGAPNVGPTGNDGNYETAIVKLADTMKQSGITIYTLGFFHNIDGSAREKCQKLMHDIASDGYDYIVENAENVNFDVADPESELYKVFNDFAEMVNGKKYINIRIECPVDVTVTYNGETLSSAKKGQKTRTSFGTLAIEQIVDDEEDADSKKSESTDTAKILRLEEGRDYEICINGTGKGKMDYTISYPDEDGEYTDVRSFKNIPITKDTVISTTTKKDSKTLLDIDSNGDGKFDLNYEADTNKNGKKTSSIDAMFIILLVSNILVGAIVILYAVMAIRRKLAEKKQNSASKHMADVCTACGAAFTGEEKFCRSCGTPRPAETIQPVQQAAPAKVKRSKAPLIIKLSIITVAAGFTTFVVSMYNSSATTVFRQLRKNQPNSAQRLYSSGVKDSGLQSSYLSFLTNRHLKKANEAYNDGKYSEEDYRTLLEGVAALKLDSASDNAKDYLKDIKKSDKNSSTSETDTSEKENQESSEE